MNVEKSARISVVIPCYNAEPWIGEALRSVMSQKCDGVEVLVVDDGSTDRSAAVIQREFPTVKLIQQSNGGASRARNVGTRAASGEFIQYLDADDLLAPGKLRTQVDLLVKTGADIAYGSYQLFTEDSIGSFQPGESSSIILTDPEVDLFWDCWLPPAAYLFRRSLVEKVGPWDETLGIVHDSKFVFDCARRGAEFVNCPGVMGYYRSDVAQSLTRGNAIKLQRDRLRYFNQVRELWTGDGDLTSERRAALVRAYGVLARSSCGHEERVFNAAVTALNALKPGYVPGSPRHLAFAARVVGYGRAERLALRYRRAKSAALKLRSTWKRLEKRYRRSSIECD